ncbi:MAG: hypothetical protein Q6352_016530, partial [Candidatus Freyrarchaeum guaymaensis]
MTTGAGAAHATAPADRRFEAPNTTRGAGAKKRYLTNHPGEPPRNESETPPESHKQAPLPTPHPSFEQYWG